MQDLWVRFPNQEIPLEMGMATHSSILAPRIPWTEEPGKLQSMESSGSSLPSPGEKIPNIGSLH